MDIANTDGTSSVRLCVDCGVTELPPAYALTSCEKCREAFARIRDYAEAKGFKAPDPLPTIVRHGDVLPMVLVELTALFREYRALKEFEAKVAVAAKSPAAWGALREEMGK